MSQVTRVIRCLLFYEFIATTGFLLNMEEKDDIRRAICEEIRRVSDGVENLIRLKPAFGIKIFKSVCDLRMLLKFYLQPKIGIIR